VIGKLFGWEAFPDDRTLGRIFELFTPAHCAELSEAEACVRKKVWGKRWFGRITLDMDSAVESVHGDQEGRPKAITRIIRGIRATTPCSVISPKRENACTTGFAPARLIRPTGRWNS
jgi:hypothetical protein